MSESNRSKFGCMLPAIVVVVGILLLLFTVFILYWARQSSAQSKVQAIVADLRSKGVPVDNASLQSRYESETTLVGADEWSSLLFTLNSKEFVSESASLPILGKDLEIPMSGEWPEEEATRDF